MNPQHVSPQTNISSKVNASPLLNRNIGSSSPMETGSKINTESPNFKSEPHNTNYLRSSVNEKRLLVKLLKANNLSSKI